MTFVKIHGTILDSSIWSESPIICKVWITMLAMADEHGVVNASVDGLARRAVVPIEDCEAALSTFMGPDRFSRDGTSGERIEPVPGGWLVLNHAQYRDKRTSAQIATAARVKRHRERTKAVTANKVTPDNAKAPSEADTDTDLKSAASAAASPKVARTRKPDPIWDAVVDVFNLNPVTKSDKTRIGKVVRDLKAKGATPELIVQACDRYRAKWPDVACTPEALLKHWETFTVNTGPTRTEIEERNLEASDVRSANRLAESRAIAESASTTEADKARREAVAEFKRKAQA